MSDMICLGSFKWSHLLLDTQKQSKLLELHPHTTDGFIHVVGGLVSDEYGRIYLHHNALANEFLLPGGKLEFNETYEEALMRELKEELDIQVERMRHVSSVKYIIGGLRRCFHMFDVEEYTGIPVNNEDKKFDQYWAKKIETDNSLWFAIEINGTITADVQDIMHSFLDLYHMWSVAPQVEKEIFLAASYKEYEPSTIKKSQHYYLSFDLSNQSYEYSWLPL